MLLIDLFRLINIDTNCEYEYISINNAIIVKAIDKIFIVFKHNGKFYKYTTLNELNMNILLNIEIDISSFKENPFDSNIMSNENIVKYILNYIDNKKQTKYKKADFYNDKLSSLININIASCNNNLHILNNYVNHKKFIMDDKYENYIIISPTHAINNHLREKLANDYACKKIIYKNVGKHFSPTVELSSFTLNDVLNMKIDSNCDYLSVSLDKNKYVKPIKFIKLCKLK